MSDTDLKKTVSFNETADAPAVAGADASPSPAAPDAQVDEVTDMFKGLAKKKAKKPKADAEDAPAETTETPSLEDAEFDPSKMKKKKKSKSKKTDFESQLAAAGLTDGVAEKPPSPEEIAQDLEAGKGIWEHNSTGPISYPLLVTRFYYLVQHHHPDLLVGGSKSYKIPPPQCLREGNRKTIFANIQEISSRMSRSEDHVMSFLFAELGTSGSVDGAGRLVIKGRLQQKHIENVLRKYIVEYVTCKTCRSPDTKLEKGENRLMFVECNSCGSRQSVAPIKTGFRGQVGRRKHA